MPSTVIQSFEDLPDRRELLVTFTTGRRYVYEYVPAEEVEAMRAAFAKGRYFNRIIQPCYHYDELDPERTYRLLSEEGAWRKFWDSIQVSVRPAGGWCVPKTISSIILTTA